MKYKEEILAAYERIGYKPRGEQVENINEIIKLFIDEGNKNVILSAPTGTGKSVIGVVVSEVLHTLTAGGSPNRASFLLTATNMLSQQYMESFAEDNDPNFLMLKGAVNYECSAMTYGGEIQTADTCSYSLLKRNGMDSIINDHCNYCEYRNSRKNKDTSRHLITNYSYYFVDRMYSSTPLSPRTCTVFDEAHLLNDLFTEHNAIYFSEKRLKAYSDEIAEYLKLSNTSIFKDIKMVRDGLIGGLINDENYKTFLEVLMDVYQTAVSSFKAEAEKNFKNQTVYLRLSKLEKKYMNLMCKISDLFTFEYPAVFEYKPKNIAQGQNEHECSIKPIFVGEMFAALDNANYNLLMSATITKEMAEKTLSLPDKTAYLRLKPCFPVENKKIVFFKPQTLNYTTMKNPDVVKQLCLNACKIVNHHSKENQRGIILTPSFVVNESIADSIRNMGGVAVFEHVRGGKLADIVEAFKAFPQGKPAVIVTPSGYEGVDLPGDFSRYQIMVKHPFASLGDKRMKVILEKYPSIYQTQSMMKVVQGAGRSVRGPDDWAVTYCLDTATQRAWKQKNINEWSDEFTAVFTNFLGD